MKMISHRGNIERKNIDTENTLYQINKCLDLGYDVEIDVWYNDNKFYLGHDFPKEIIGVQDLIQPRLWCHAKNYQALLQMQKLDIHYFWHQIDGYTLTSKNIIWAYPGFPIGHNTVCVLPEYNNIYTHDDLQKCYGICSDKIMYYCNSVDCYL